MATRRARTIVRAADLTDQRCPAPEDLANEAHLLAWPSLPGTFRLPSADATKPPVTRTTDPGSRR
jgi:hypothetical protein